MRGMRPRSPFPTALALAAILGAHAPAAGDATFRFESATGLALVPVARGLDRPLHVAAPAGDPRLFIVEQAGRIRTLEGGRLLPRPFLDLTDRVRSGGERGLLSVAFHPRYASNGFLYVNYTDRAGDTRIERYQVTRDPDRADPASAKLVLSIHQPYSNHNGGHIQFGPDGMLWIGMGDGGSGGDPQGHGRDRSSLLASMLRIDVDRGEPYAIPPGNPFVRTSGARGEVWAKGLRNPWRFCFDRVDSVLWIADVGQNQWEEVNAVRWDAAGLDYGWNLLEGTHDYAAPGAARAGLTLPVLEYPHREGCSVTGGVVYRGRALPALRGRYLFGDYCSGWIRSVRLERGRVTEPREWRLPKVEGLSSFGEDARGEVYVTSLAGTVYRLAPPYRSR